MSSGTHPPATPPCDYHASAFHCAAGFLRFLPSKQKGEASRTDTASGSATRGLERIVYDAADTLKGGRRMSTAGCLLSRFLFDSAIVNELLRSSTTKHNQAPFGVESQLF